MAAAWTPGPKGVRPGDSSHKELLNRLCGGEQSRLRGFALVRLLNRLRGDELFAKLDMPVPGLLNRLRGDEHYGRRGSGP